MHSAPEGYNKAQVQEVIDLYARMHPTGINSIAAAILSAKEEQRELELSHRLTSKGVVKGNTMNRRMSFTMPSDLYIILRKKFPQIFGSDKKKFERDFPVFFKAWKP